MTAECAKIWLSLINLVRDVPVFSLKHLSNFHWLMNVNSLDFYNKRICTVLSAVNSNNTNKKGNGGLKQFCHQVSFFKQRYHLVICFYIPKMRTVEIKYQCNGKKCYITSVLAMVPSPCIM